MAISRSSSPKEAQCISPTDGVYSLNVHPPRTSPHRIPTHLTSLDSLNHHVCPSGDQHRLRGLCVADQSSRQEGFGCHSRRDGNDLAQTRMGRDWSLCGADSQGDSMQIDNVTLAGRKADGFIIPAGSMFPLGCAIPNHTVGDYSVDEENADGPGIAARNVLPARDNGTYCRSSLGLTTL